MAEITDVIVQDVSGIPYFARCFASEYCRTYSDHALLSGFFAAINAFKQELSQEFLRSVGFDNLNLVIESQDPIMVIFAAEVGYDPTELRSMAKEILRNFLIIHSDNPDSLDFDDPVINDEFSNWLVNRIGRSTSNLRPLLEKKREGLWARLRSKLV